MNKISSNSPLLKSVVMRAMAKRNCPYNRTGQNLRGKDRHWCGKLGELVTDEFSIHQAQFLPVFTAKLRALINHFTAGWTRVFIAFIVSPMSFILFLFCCNHKYSISDL